MLNNVVFNQNNNFHWSICHNNVLLLLYFHVWSFISLTTAASGAVSATVITAAAAAVACLGNQDMGDGFCDKVSCFSCEYSC